MTYNRDKAHEVSDDGLLISDGPHVIGGSTAPTVALPAPTGDTLYVETSTGRLWTWKGTGPWKIETNFSYLRLAAGESARIQAGEQLLFSGDLVVLGHLEVAGDLLDVSGRQPEQFMYSEILPNATIAVWTNRMLFYKNNLYVRGHLRVLGEVQPV
jgi:hypothetical protein